MSRALTITLLAVSGLTGCGSSDSPDFSAFHGIYQMAGHTRNDRGCEADGDVVAGTPALLVVFTKYMQTVAITCADEAACRAQAAESSAAAMNSDFMAEFVQVSADGTTMTGTLACQGGGGTNNVLRKSGNAIRAESRTYRAPMSNGGCTGHLVAQPVTGTCSELEVAEASFLAPL